MGFVNLSELRRFFASLRMTSDGTFGSRRYGLPDSPDKDPVVSQSLAVYLLIVSVLLLITLWWSLYDEFFGLRPWKEHQRAFVQRYGAFLRKQIPIQRAKEKTI